MYGARAADVLGYAAHDSRLRARLPGTAAIAAEIPFGVRSELATSLTDLYLRRTMIGLGADLGLATLPAVTAIARETLGWSAERAAAEADAYIAAAARYLDPAAASAR